MNSLTEAPFPEDFDQLYEDCLSRTRTRAPGDGSLRRARARALAEAYWRGPIGPICECGVLRGLTGLLLCRLARRRGNRDGAGIFLIDSFEGLSPPGAQDLVEVRSPDGEVRKVVTHEAGYFAVSRESVERSFEEFPGVRFIQGWIPQILRTLPQQDWSFVHLDLDLYEPTLGALRYFYRRKAAGGRIVCDDYVSRSFPGAGRAVRMFCKSSRQSFQELPTGQALL